MESRCSFTRSHSTSVMVTAFAFSIRGRSGQLLRSGAQGPSRDSKGHSFARYGARFHGDEIGISGSASQSDCQPGIGSPIHNASWQNAAQGSKVPMCSTKQVGSRSGGHPEALCNGPRYFRPPFSHWAPSRPCFCGVNLDGLRAAFAFECPRPAPDHHRRNSSWVGMLA